MRWYARTADRGRAMNRIQFMLRSTMRMASKVLASRKAT